MLLSWFKIENKKKIKFISLENSHVYVPLTTTLQQQHHCTNYSIIGVIFLKRWIVTGLFREIKRGRKSIEVDVTSESDNGLAEYRVKPAVNERRPGAKVRQVRNFR